MDYQIIINTGNDAFFKCEGEEVGRILRRLANDVETMGLCEYNLRDGNGNKVGEAGEVTS